MEGPAAGRLEPQDGAVHVGDVPRPVGRRVGRGAGADVFLRDDGAGPAFILPADVFLVAQEGKEGAPHPRGRREGHLRRVGARRGGRRLAGTGSAKRERAAERRAGYVGHLRWTGRRRRTGGGGSSCRHGRGGRGCVASACGEEGVDPLLQRVLPLPAAVVRRVVCAGGRRGERGAVPSLPLPLGPPRLASFVEAEQLHGIPREIIHLVEGQQRREAQVHKAQVHAVVSLARRVIFVL
mmetsp:Transcript_5107/g.10780  ORF Transcript_5107/g.10780 Transcript_5107/m.10780 type:complete len:238 (-) Transcript_5107:246-959(-)